MKQKKLFLTFTALGILMLACSLSPLVQEPTQIPGLASTSVAATLERQLTEVAMRATNTPLPPEPTATLPPPTATNLPTITPLPTLTRTPVPTATPIPCNRAAFITDVTVADGTIFTPSSHFSKVWRLRNNGSCAWTSDYELVYHSGNRMKGDSVTEFQTRVEPGEYIDVGINLTAPTSSGEYLGNWMLRSKNGHLFGLGVRGDKPFWVNIEVIGTSSGAVYDFAENICAAGWEDKIAPLPCQGTDGSEANIVRLSDSLIFEGGTEEDELALWIQIGKSNQVSGIFPKLVISAADRFVSRIGCIDGSTDCHARFTLSYKEVGVGTVVELGSWIEKHDDSTRLVDMDLSSLAGKNVKMILTVTSLTNAGPTEVFWFVPRVLSP